MTMNTPASVNGLVEMDFSEVRALGKTLAEHARENPRLLKRALGLQVRNTQKSIAAVVRNYRIRHKVGGRNVDLERFSPRHPITISLHGRKGGGKLADERSVSVSAIEGGFEVGYKGGLREYASRWQEGGKVGLFQDRRANRIRRRLFQADWDAALADPPFLWKVYKTLGRLYGIHTPEALEAAQGESTAGAYGVLRAMVFKRLREEGNTLLENPKTWKGRPFIGRLADDLRERFAPSVAAILEKRLRADLSNKGT